MRPYLEAGSLQTSLVQMRLCRSRVGPTSVTGVLKRRKQRHRDPPQREDSPVMVEEEVGERRPQPRAV